MVAAESPLPVAQVVRNSSSGVTPCIVMQNDGDLHHQMWSFSPESSFAKVKEPLRGIRYNTRNELFRAIARSIRNVKKNRRADGVRGLPNILKR